MLKHRMSKNLNAKFMQWDVKWLYYGSLIKSPFQLTFSMATSGPFNDDRSEL